MHFEFILDNYFYMNGSIRRISEAFEKLKIF